MEELVRRLQAALDSAARACCSAKPAEDTAYHFGRAQGKFAGLQDALKIIQDWDEEDAPDAQFDVDEERA